MKLSIIIKTGIFLFTLSVDLINAQTYPCPINGNAESNSFTNWTTYTSQAENPQQLNGFAPNFDAGRFGVHDGISNYPQGQNGSDIYGDFPVPSEGTYFFRVGNDLSGAQAEAMRYTFTVTPENKNFKLRYALVLEDGGHSLGENPAAWFYFVKGATMTPSFNNLSLWSNTITSFVADLSNPFYKKSPNVNSVVYRPWECIEFDLSQYIGQTLSFVAMVRDCTQGGHFGYLYLDGLCTEWPAIASGSLNGTTFCLEEDIILDGSASEGEDSYFIEVAEVDANNNYVSGGLDISEWFVAEQAPSNFNVSDYIDSKGKVLICGKRYKVKLAVANQCAEWNETNLYFDVVCPEIDAGPDVIQCCFGDGFQQDFSIGDTYVAGNTYSWSSIPVGFTGNASAYNVYPTENISYIVEMQTPGGCIGRDTVVFRFIPNQFDVTLTSKYELCDYKPYVTAHVGNTTNCIPSPEFEAVFGAVDNSIIEWYFQPTNGSSSLIGTGKTIHAPNADGVLTAQVNHSHCNSSGTKSMQLSYRPGGSGLIAPNTFTPDGGQYNNVFRILEYGLNAPINVGEGPAYGISDFKLRIWNRWGENFKTVTKADAGRQPDENPMQGDIFWDGTNNAGEVQDGVYPYSLELKRCGQNEFERVCLPGGEENPCIRWIWFFCVERLEGCMNHVNVLR